MRLSSTVLSLLIATARISASFNSSSFASRHSRTLSTTGTAVSTRGGSSSSTTNSSTALNSAVATEAAAAAAPVEYFRNDYEPLTNIVTKISMNFDIHDGKTTVTSKMNIEANPNGLGAGDLVLDGDETSVALMKLTLDGRELEEGKDYELVPGKLIVKKEAFQGNDGSGLLETVVEIVPEDNTKLSGKFWLCLFGIDLNWIVFLFVELNNSEWNWINNTMYEWVVYYIFSHTFPYCDLYTRMNPRTLQIWTHVHHPMRSNGFQKYYILSWQVSSNQRLCTPTCTCFLFHLFSTVW